MTTGNAVRASDVEALAVAIVNYAVDLLEVHADKELVAAAAIAQLDLDIFEDQLALGEIEIDSLALVELFATFEAELGVPLFEQDDIESISTLRGLSELALAEASPEVVAEFVATWGSA
jgi:acyl carrier protein